uniref:Family with sequence similarity 92 member B n=1 Tax=Cynoglossus semilaevis TaxID=244447 RepID=A0A3P8VN77_CYNSE
MLYLTSCLVDYSPNVMDFQVKSLEQKVKHAKKHLGDICNLMGSYTRKTAKLRDKADQLVAQLFDYSSSEGPELQMSLRNFAEDLAIVQDYRQAQVRNPACWLLFLYNHRPFQLKAFVELKRFRSDLNREVKELQKLDRIRLRNPADRQSIAEVSAQKASNNAQRGGRHLEESFTDFQRQKLEHRIFTDFITVEMLFHAKALEIYTGTYHNLEAINKDPEVFQTFKIICLEEEEDEEEEVEEEEDEEEEVEEMCESEVEEDQHTSRQSLATKYPRIRRWQY